MTGIIHGRKIDEIDKQTIAINESSSIDLFLLLFKIMDENASLLQRIEALEGA